MKQLKDVFVIWPHGGRKLKIEKCEYSCVNYFEGILLLAYYEKQLKMSYLLKKRLIFFII